MNLCHAIWVDKCSDNIHGHYEKNIQKLSDCSIIVFMDDILIYSDIEEDDENI